MIHHLSGIRPTRNQSFQATGPRHTRVGDPPNSFNDSRLHDSMNIRTRGDKRDRFLSLETVVRAVSPLP